ncbi:MAG: hypothetical protein LBS35_13505 [Synergistaceae bacterium]|jgi:hypothetical protein|nr:hypothetical protein [Synergistaceae bacterium]
MQEDWNGLSSFQVGSVLSVSWRTLFKAPGIFIGLTFVANLLTAIVGVVTNMGSVDGVSAIVTFLSLLINMILSLVIQGAIAYAVFQVIIGGRALLGESVSKSASKIFALIGLAIISGFSVGLASILLLLPGIILLCMWYVSAPACVVERLGPIESLGRSRALTKGYRWQVLGVMVLLFLITMLTNALFAFLMRVFVRDVLLRVILTPVVTGLAALIPNAFVNVGAAVTYYRLRMVKENLTMENLADVFD